MIASLVQKWWSSGRVYRNFRTHAEILPPRPEATWPNASIDDRKLSERSGTVSNRIGYYPAEKIGDMAADQFRHIVAPELGLRQSGGIDQDHS